MTVYARTLCSTPQRSARQTWELVIDLIAGEDDQAAAELLSVSGVASSTIASQACVDSPITVRGGGPLVRIRCLYGEDAITGERANERALPSNPTEGDDWVVSLPTLPEDLDWVRSSLASKTSRVVARALGDDAHDGQAEGSTRESSSPSINPETFLSS